MLVDADGDLNKLTSVLVTDIDAVLPRVIRSDLVDHQAGKFTTIKCDPGVFVGDHFLLILEPSDLRCWLTPYGAGQAQRLRGRSNKLNLQSSQNGTIKKSHGTTNKSPRCAAGISMLRDWNYI